MSGRKPSRQAAAAQLDPLQRLQTDVLDLLQSHEIIRLKDPDPIFSEGRALEAVVAAKKAAFKSANGFDGTARNISTKPAGNGLEGFAGTMLGQQKTRRPLDAGSAGCWSCRVGGNTQLDANTLTRGGGERLRIRQDDRPSVTTAMHAHQPA